MSDLLQEHLGYLSDGKRLELFRDAIARTIAPGDTVADLGCGFGILGLMCLQAGAGQVWGIDRTDAIDVARETMERAGHGHHYHCLREHTFRAVLPEPVDLIVCDHIGYFGFDYGIVAMIGDARRRMLRPGGKLVPSRIRLMLAGAASPRCRDKAEAWASTPIPAEFAWLRQYGVNASHAYAFDPAEIATEPVTLGEIDLRVDNPAHFAFEARLQARSDCRIDGLGGWFEAELAPGVWMTNSPLAADRIDRGQIFLPFDAPIGLVAGETLEVSLSIRHEDGMLAWSARPQGGGQRQKQSNWASLVLNTQKIGEGVARKPKLNPAGHAAGIVHGYVDGQRSAGEIEAAVLRDHPHLFPSAEETSRFVLSELARIAG